MYGIAVSSVTIFNHQAGMHASKRSKAAVFEDPESGPQTQTHPRTQTHTYTLAHTQKHTRTETHTRPPRTRTFEQGCQNLEQVLKQSEVTTSVKTIRGANLKPRVSILTRGIS